MKIVQTGLTEWVNQHQTFAESIKSLAIAGNEPDLDALESYNDTTKGFQIQLREAIKNNTPFRSLGSGWSWTKIATAKDGVMIDTKQLNTTIGISPRSVAPSYTGDINKLLFAQCGNGIWELGNELRTKDLSLKTSGASSGQTIVGAMSTGAHGSSLDVGAVQDFIIGLHLIVGPDRHIWLERKSAPVVSDFFIQKLQTELVQDDDLFNSALVSFGSFGIIHGVMLEAEELFLLEAYLRKMPYDDSLKKLMETLDFSNANLPNGNERPFHFEVMIDPYDIKNGAYVYSFYKRPYRNGYQPAVANEAGIGAGDDAACFIWKLQTVIPALIPTIVTNLLGGSLKPFEKQWGTLAEIFNNTILHGKLYSAAIGLPPEQVSRVTELLLEINDKSGPFPGLFAYRFIKKSQATLAFTRFDYTCILELDAAPSDGTLNFYKEVWNRLDEEKIPFTMHWGKMNDLDFDRLTRMYGTDLDTWIAARNKLLDADCRKVFSNPLLHQWGLDKVVI